MNKIFAKAVVNFYGIVFIVAAGSAIFLGSKAIVGIIVLGWAGIALLRRKQFGVYVVLFLSLVLSGLGALLLWVVVSDMLHKVYKFDMLFIGLAPVVLSVATFFLFTRPAVAQEFGLEKITILEKVDKKELVATFRILLGIVAVIGAVLLFSYFVAMRMSR